MADAQKWFPRDAQPQWSGEPFSSSDIECPAATRMPEEVLDEDLA
jgi:hypothetical protein